jgi:hypothetical protein
LVGLDPGEPDKGGSLAGDALLAGWEGFKGSGRVGEADEA